MVKLIGLLFIVFALAGSKISRSEMIIDAGEVSGTWYKALSPYLINGDITIPNDSILTIEPGVAVQFQGHFALNVQGRLLAIGLEGDSILFTRNDTTGFHAQDTTGGWNGINFIDTPLANDSSQISYCRLEYGKAVADFWHLNAGGALCIINFDKLLISDCRFTNNIAGGRESDSPAGGAIHLAWSDIIIRTTIFSDNRAWLGGAVQFHKSDPVFDRCIFTGNQAQNAGAVATSDSCHPVFLNCIFNENHAIQNGGGIKIDAASDALLQGGSFSANTADIGGGISAWGCKIQMDNAVFSDNSAANLGGGISADNCSLKVVYSSFERNEANWGGAIHCFDTYVQLREYFINQNTAQDLSGGIHADFSSLAISNGTFYNNSAEIGAGIHSWFSEIKITTSVFKNNASTAESGAINVQFSRAELDTCDFIANTASHGGAMRIHNSDFYLDSCTFRQNQALAGDCGAINYSVDSTIFGRAYQVKLSKSRFIENSATGITGGVRIEQYNTDFSLADILVDKCRFIRNHSDVYAALRISGSLSDFTVANCLFMSNTSNRYVAGSAFVAGSSGQVYNCVYYANYSVSSDTSGTCSNATLGSGATVDFFNCTITDTSNRGGYGISARRGCKLNLVNSIIWGNGLQPLSLTTAAGLGCTATVNYCLIKNGRDSVYVSDSLSILNWGESNLDLDPQFIDFVGADLHLKDESPCLGAGVNCLILDDAWRCAPLYDYDNVSRPLPAGTNCDIGAYEHSLDQPVVILATDQPVRSFDLFQNSPNPFNPSTVISWQLAVGSYVDLSIYNLLGEKVITLVSEAQTAGHHHIQWDASRFASGVYYYRLGTDKGMVRSRRLVLLK